MQFFGLAFLLYSYKSNVKIESLILDEAMTVHNAQGSGFDYMMADLDQKSTCTN